MTSNQAEQPSDPNISSDVSHSQNNEPGVNTTTAQPATEENPSQAPPPQVNQNTTAPQSPALAPSQEPIELGSGSPNTPIQQQEAFDTTTANAQIHSGNIADSPLSNSHGLAANPVNSEQIFSPLPPPTSDSIQTRLHDDANPSIPPRATMGDPALETRPENQVERADPPPAYTPTPSPSAVTSAANPSSTHASSSGEYIFNDFTQHSVFSPFGSPRSTSLSAVPTPSPTRVEQPAGENTRTEEVAGARPPQIDPLKPLPSLPREERADGDDTVSNPSGTSRVVGSPEAEQGRDDAKEENERREGDSFDPAKKTRGSQSETIGNDDSIEQEVRAGGSSDPVSADSPQQPSPDQAEVGISQKDETPPNADAANTTAQPSPQPDPVAIPAVNPAVNPGQGQANPNPPQPTGFWEIGICTYRQCPIYCIFCDLLCIPCVILIDGTPGERGWNGIPA